MEEQCQAWLVSLFDGDEDATPDVSTPTMRTCTAAWVSKALNHLDSNSTRAVESTIRKLDILKCWSPSFREAARPYGGASGDTVEVIQQERFRHDALR